MSVLSQPLLLSNGVTLPNRFVKSATSEQLGDRNRNPRKELARLYQSWSEGGAGLLISGNIMVDRTALGEPFNVVLDEESDLSAFKVWTKAATSKGNHFWAQINHPGKQSPKVLSKQPVAPSSIPLEGSLAKAFNKPKALSEDEIQVLVKRFATTAKLAKEVGFTGVQIHGAHGYLVSQFLSPKHNQRNDQWGGSLKNRMRFVLDIYKAIRNEVGESFPVAIKLNSADFQKGGFTEEESIQVATILVEQGIDFIEISGGSYENPVMTTGQSLSNTKKESTYQREAYFLNYANSLRAECQIPLAVTGGFRSTKGMEYAITSGGADMIGMARPMILQPNLPQMALASSNFAFNWNEPTTGFKTLDSMTMLVLIWYEKQMWRVARGQQPKLTLSPWVAALTSIWKVITKPNVARRV